MKVFVEKEVKFIICEVEKNVDWILSDLFFKVCKIVIEIEDLKC